MAEIEALAKPTETTASAEDMDLETLSSPAQNPDDGGDDPNGVSNDDSNLKRGREEEEEEGEGNDDVSKKQKVEKSVEEERLQQKSGLSESGPVQLGPKEFGSSVEMFDYFFNLLHIWPNNLNLNKYEHMVLLELLKKGHQEPEKKIGEGVKAFQIRNHPLWKSKCFFVIRDDESVEDFSFRKCVDHILPLPEQMRVKPDANRALGGGGWKGKRGGKGGGRGRGRGGKSRN